MLFKASTVSSVSRMAAIRSPALFCPLQSTEGLLGIPWLLANVISWAWSQGLAAWSVSALGAGEVVRSVHSIHQCQFEFRQSDPGWNRETLSARVGTA